jgi:hypothetical protein
MNDTTVATTSVWSGQRLREHPVRTLGIVLFLLLRTLFGLFWLAAGINKLRKGWLTSEFPGRVPGELRDPALQARRVGRHLQRALCRRRLAARADDALGCRRGAVHPA